MFSEKNGLLSVVHPGVAAQCPLNWSSSYSVKRKMSREGYQSGNNYCIRGQGWIHRRWCAHFSPLASESSNVIFIGSWSWLGGKLKVSVRSVHRLFRVPPTIFLHYGSECFLFSSLLPKAQAIGRPKLCHRSWIRLFFQARPVLLLEPWANQLIPGVLTDKRTKCYLSPELF